MIFFNPHSPTFESCLVHQPLRQETYRSVLVVVVPIEHSIHFIVIIYYNISCRHLYQNYLLQTIVLSITFLATNDPIECGPVLFLLKFFELLFLRWFIFHLILKLINLWKRFLITFKSAAEIPLSLF